jgi:hypothetical protein
MKPIEFPLMNCKVSENQDEYITLPAFQDESYTISCWQFTWKERLRFLLTGKLWTLLMNFGGPVQPMSFDLECPLEVHKKES